MTIDEVLRYIDENLTEDLRLVDIAKMVGYSPWHLYKLLSLQTRKPIMTYIREARIKKAASEMASGRRLYDIAVDYRFNTQAGFYKAFESIIGCSPSEYSAHEIRRVHSQNSKLVNIIDIGENFMQEVIIRKVRQSDTKDLWENILSRNTPAEVEARVAENIEKMKSGDCINYVAEIDGAVIGNMLLIREAHPLERHKCSLYDVVVNPAFQRMGIARMLFYECKEQAKIMGCKLITVNARGGTTAEEVYKRLGFTEAGRIPGGIVETWGEFNVYDDVFFYQTL